MTQIFLRELEPEDISQLNRWRNDKELIDSLGNNFRFISKNVDQAWYKDYLQHRNKNVRLAIIHAQDNRHIGNINLSDIDPINASAELSIMIGEKQYRSKGIGTEATFMMINHGFKNLNLHRIYLTVLQHNEPATRLYKKIGFTIDGVHRQAIFKNGIYNDVVVMSLLKHEHIRDK